MTKMFSASGGGSAPPPDSLTRGPWTPLGALPPDPVIGSCSALAMVSPNHCTDPFRRLCLQVLVAESLARPTACERTKFRITPRAVVFIATAAAIYSIGHGLRTVTVVPRSTQLSTLCRTKVKLSVSWGLSGRGLARWLDSRDRGSNPGQDEKNRDEK